MNKLKIGVVGAGAVGGVISALLAQKGYDVEVAKRYNSDLVLDEYAGIELLGEFGHRHILVKSVNGVKNFTTKKDIIFVLTRAYDAPNVAKQCLPHLTEHGIVVSSQNVMNVEEMIRVVGSNKLFGLIINWSATRLNKAKIQVTKQGDMVVGSFGNKSQAYLDILQRILSNVAPTVVSDNIIGDIWARTILNSCISSVGALTGVNLGKSMMVPFANKVFTNIITEAMALSKKLNVNVRNYGGLNYYEFVKPGLGAMMYRRKMLRRLRKQNGKCVSSCMRCIENNVESEIEYLNGHLVKLGKKVGMQLPTNKRVYDMVKEVESGERYMTLENLLDYYLRHPKKYLKTIKLKEV